MSINLLHSYKYTDGYNVYMNAQACRTNIYEEVPSQVKILILNKWYIRIRIWCNRRLHFLGNILCSIFTASLKKYVLLYVIEFNVLKVISSSSRGWIVFFLFYFFFHFTKIKCPAIKVINQTFHIPFMQCVLHKL